MKRIMFALVLGFGLVISVSSCSKCKVCTYPASTGTPSQEYCDGDGLGETAFETACAVNGGSITEE